MLEPQYRERLRNLEKKISVLIGKDAKFFPPEKEKWLRQPFLINVECVNQFGICE